ncbi:MAG: TonB-dependent receptor [Steroidobacteraceae bacterium]|jgi:outer membrane receptor protein involved in Fe transport|nr:TonB-dependent receptor [Steroidobacteraceae bacterium]
MASKVQHLGCSIVSLTCTAVALGASPGVWAADTEPAVGFGGLEEVVVSARKRIESSQDVPVAVSVLSAEQIRRADLTSLEKVAAFSPGFTVGRASSGSGAQLTLRGIGSSSTSIGIEQSVAVVVDGVYYGQGRIIQEGFFDLSRLEILKGPQALFFGKNATAGVISITTADPSNELEIMGRAGYEFESEQSQLEAVVSAPLSDTLGLRVALRGSTMSGGYFKNVAQPVSYNTFDIATGAVTPHTAQPTDKDQPGEEEVLGRVTLKWTPTERLTATLKASGDYNEVDNSSWNYVIFKCADGVSTLNPDYRCKSDFISHQNNMPADIAASVPFAKSDGALYNRYKSYALTGSLNYELDNITITSVTNYNRNNNRWTCDCDFQSSDNNTWATEDSTWRAFSSELRALTDYEFPVNGMLGVLYQKTKRDFYQTVIFAGLEDSSVAPQYRYLASTKDSFTEGETFAAFGQLIWEITPALEATAGVRYTHETKDSWHAQPYNNAALLAIFRPADSADGLGFVTAEQTFENWSPEATLTWKMSDDVMIYGAYKTAYKSGGFSNSGINSAFSTDPAADLTFEPEEAKGFEAGVKSTLLDNQLLFNIALYSYKYEDLQVDFFNAPIFAYQTVTGDARTSGVEVDLQYAPRALPGLTLRGSINYNDAHYTRFDGPCYAGQTPAAGCTLIGPSGAPFQNLDDQDLGMAPEWTGTLGGSYETRVGAGLRLGVSIDARYSAEYLASGFGLAASRQDSYVQLDAGIRLGRDDERWELALVGKNLTNRFYVTGVNDGPSTGSGTGTPAGIIADQAGYAALPRTVQAQMTVRF